MKIKTLLFLSFLFLFENKSFSLEHGISDSSDYTFPFALVLSGGGTRGIAQIGVIKALEEADIKPDLIVATSIGAVIGALYSAGYSALELEELLKTVNIDNFFNNRAERKNLFVYQKTEPSNYILEIRFDNDLKPILPQSISDGQAFFELLSPRIASAMVLSNNNFDKLPIALRVIATDIISGKKVVFKNGNLASAVRASCSAPLAFSPFEYAGTLLMDGGLTENIPVLTARQAGAQHVVAIDVTSPMWSKEDLSNPVKLVNQVLSIGIEHNKEIQKEMADLVITPPLDGFLNNNFSALDSLIAIGYEEGKKYVHTIKENSNAIESNHLHPVDDKEYISAPIFWKTHKTVPIDQLNPIVDTLKNRFGDSIPLIDMRQKINALFDRKNLPFAHIVAIKKETNGTQIEINPGVIHEIKIYGTAITSDHFIHSAITLHEGDILTNRLIEKAINDLYATDFFNHVDISLEENNTVIIIIDEKYYLRSRFGLRFDEFHLWESYLQPAHENLFGLGICAAMHIQYGPIREKYAFEIESNQLFTPNWAQNIRFQTYIAREKSFSKDTTFKIYPNYPDSTYFEMVNNIESVTLRKAGLTLLMGIQLGKFSMLEGGVRIERFNVTRSTVGAFDDPLGAFKHGLRYITTRFYFDNVDKFIFPQHGQKHLISLGGASEKLGGTESFMSIHMTSKVYKTILTNHTFSPQIHLSWANKSLPDIERVFLGGALPEEQYKEVSLFNQYSFSGLKPRTISGDVAFSVRGMYRLKLSKGFNLYGILNWGYVWDQPDFNNGDIDIAESLRDAPLGLSITLSYLTPLGPIKGSWARLVHSGDKLTDRFSIDEQNLFYISAGYDF